jgi:hypothetical protein
VSGSIPPAPYDGCRADQASLNTPADVSLDAAGNLYITENGNRVRRVDAVDQIITSVAGNGTACTYPSGGSLGCGDMDPTAAAPTAQNAANLSTLNNPNSAAVDGAGNLFIADTSNNRLRQVSKDGAPIDFGFVLAGSTSAPKTFIVANIGNGSATSSPSTEWTWTGAQAATTAAGDPFNILGTTGSGLHTTCTLSTPLSAGTSCYVAADFAPAAAGIFGSKATAADNSLMVSSQQEVSLSGTSPTFTVSPSTISVTVVRGQTGGSLLYTVNSLDNFSGPVSFTCNLGSPSTAGSAASQVNYSFPSVTLTADGSATATLTVTAKTTPSAQRGRGLLPWTGMSVVLAICPLAIGVRRSPKSAALLLLALVLVTGMLLLGCGGGFVGQPGSTSGQYSGVFNCTASDTSGLITQTVTIDVTVQ